MKTLRRILGVLLIFLLGVFIGSAATSAGVMKKLRNSLLGGPEAVMEVIVQRLDKELKLDAEQKRRLQTIMDETSIRLRQSREKIKPELEEALREAEVRTRAILYPRQMKRFDELVGKGREEWKTREAVSATPAPAPAAPALGATPAPL